MQLRPTKVLDLGGGGGAGVKLGVGATAKRDGWKRDRVYGSRARSASWLSTAASTLCSPVQWVDTCCTMLWGDSNMSYNKVLKSEVDTSCYC